MIINGRFNVLHELGEGGFGKVFLVDDHETKELCALKLIKPELSEVFGIQDKFREEATTWMAFGKHPNIVGVRSVDLFNGYLSIALEYVAPSENGVNCLDKYLETRRVSTRKALTWAIQLCDALTYANKRGMVAHRDLKPSNIMIAHDDSIKLTDFGLAVFNADPSNVAVDVSPSGTPAYMPPEQFRHGSNIDQRSDIYSFGIVLYEIITGGQLPFKLGNVPDGHLFEYFH